MKQTGAERDGDGGNRQEAALVNHADKVHSACVTEHRLNTLPLEIHFHEQSLTWISPTQTLEYSHTHLCVTGTRGCYLRLNGRGTQGITESCIFLSSQSDEVSFYQNIV